MINTGGITIGQESVSTSWRFDNFGSIVIDGQLVTRSAILRAGSTTCGTGILWYLFGHLVVEDGADVCGSLDLRPYGGGNDFRTVCARSTSIDPAPKSKVGNPGAVGKISKQFEPRKGVVR